MRRISFLLIVAALAGAAPGGAGQGPQGEAAPVPAAGLAEINATLKQLVALVELQVRNQRTQLAIQRLDLARRDVVARERELHDVLTSRDALEEQQTSMKARLEAFEDDPEAVGIGEEELEEYRLHAKIESEALKQRTWRLDQRALELQAEIARAQEDVKAWEELVADSF